MALNHIQTSFSFGETSPRLLARVDLAAFNQATKTMENAYPFLHGGCRRRPGTLYVGETINANEEVKLIPFTSSNTKSFVLVLNGGKVEFVTNGGFVMNGGSRYQLTIPYASADLADLNYAQIGNVMFFAHPNYPTKQLVRITDTNWAISDIAFTCRAVSDFSFENFAIRFKILKGGTQSAPGHSYTIVTNGAGGIASYSGHSAGIGYGSLAAVSATSLAPAETWTINCVYADANRAEWTVTGSISGTPTASWCANNYPTAVTFFQQRLWLAGTATYPQKLWSSKTGDYTNFTLGPLDSDGLAIEMASDTYDQIMHLVSTRALLPLTYGSEYAIEGGVNSGITPSAVRAVKQSRHGSINVKPIFIGKEVIFAQRDSLKIRALSFDTLQDSNVAPDITLFSEHITNSGAKDMTFAQSPDYIAWITKNNGELLSLTLARDYDTIGWARHVTDGDFERVTCIPQGSSDDVYFSVKRTVNGVAKRYIELLDYYFDTFSDASVVKTNVTPQTVWAGLSHLEGKTVDVVADGLVHGQRLVTAGQITLDYAASEVRIGIHYDTTIELLHPELANTMDSSQGKKVSFHEAVVRLQDTIGCRINNYELPFRKTTDGLNSVIPPFTGDKSVPLVGWHSPNNLRIQQVLPMPFTLLGVILKATATS